MTAYVKLDTMEYPIYEGDIKLRHPNISFTSNFTPPDGYAKVFPSHRPNVNWDQIIVCDGVEHVDGIWKERVYVRNATDEEKTNILNIKWQEIRLLRNKLLADSDWTQLNDIDVSLKELYKSYRQALRDITNQPDPFNINWPTIN